MSDLWFQDLRNPRKPSAIIRGGDLQTETLYFGYKASRQLIVYNKNQEQGRPRTATPWLRIEYRYNKGDYRLCDLFEHLRNPFDGFVVRRYAPQAATLRNARQLFEACCLCGIERVIASAPEPERVQLRASINSFPYWETWTRRHSIWNQLRHRIAELLPVV